MSGGLREESTDLVIGVDIKFNLQNIVVGKMCMRFMHETVRLRGSTHLLPCKSLDGKTDEMKFIDDGIFDLP